MKVGDLVKVKPSRTRYFLIVGEDPEKENNHSSTDEPLGRLFELYDMQEHEVRCMYEKWIEVVK